MWSILRNPLRKSFGPLHRYGHGYPGGQPGVNIPFNMDNPMRFTLIYFIAGFVGFGAPALVFRHQMLRDVKPA
ncbi:hypothetical protein KR018_010508 [Drosophila ironensis]|nr:hypothetical protein KR018_010508 [Drosophila ironensis]